MQLVRPDNLPYPDFPWPPGEDDLPSSDGMPMETDRHVQQMNLLVETLKLAWTDRDDAYVAGNMFVYFSPDQVRNEDFRGPDVFAVQGVTKRERKSWVVWQEGKGPDIVIELLSESTAHVDKTRKKLIYQDKLRVPEYVWFDPFTGELAGFALRDGAYEPIDPDAMGRLHSRQLGLVLLHWQGTYNGIEAVWLRWALPDGIVLPTSAERAEEERRHAEEERRRADVAERRIAELEARIARLESLGAHDPNEDPPPA